MKNTLKIGLVSTLIGLALMGCENEKMDTTERAAPAPTSTQKVLSKAPGGCWCDFINIDKDCGECVTGLEGIMKGQKTATYTVTWTKCESDDPNWIGCKGTQNAKTTLTFCYGDGTYVTPTPDCDLYMQVDNPPECLKCLANYTFCEKMTVVCSQSNGKNIDVTLSHANGGELETITYTIVGDPKIEIKCKGYDNNGILRTYKCQGEF